MTEPVYGLLQRGSLHSSSYRIFVTREDMDHLPISALNDIPLWFNEEEETAHMLVEIPRWSNAKLELDARSLLTPILHDTKKNELRYVSNCFPHKGYPWNYGCFPQTWEDPEHWDEATRCRGDNDPLDVCELGNSILPTGSVAKVKIIGALGLIDQGETDWKILAISIADPLSQLVRDVEDLERHRPGLIQSMVHWLKIYKVPKGETVNSIALEERPQKREFAVNILHETHRAYWQMRREAIVRKGSHRRFNIEAVLREDARITHQLARDEVSKYQEKGPDQTMPEDVDVWHFV